MKRVALSTLGCKVNQYESAAFASAFEARGCRLVPFAAEADIYVINTCAVTGRAGQQSRQLIRRVLAAHPGALVVVTGCYAQLEPETVRTLGGGLLTVIGNGCKHRLVEAALAGNPPDPGLLIGPIRENRTICPLPVGGFRGRTRAFLRVQDGCDNFCSYCIVPYTRGPSRSLSLAEVIAQAEVFAEAGYQELVITGINVGKYGLDLREGETICSLLDRLCAHLPNMRIRLSSIEPTEVNDTLLAIMDDRDNFMPHLHIPLQSGDDAVLARMNRRYDRAGFAAVIRRIHERFSHAAIGCDVLAGFPGESEAEAETTWQLLAGLPVHYLHVFPYSRRPGTPADTLPGQLPKAVKEARVARLRQLDGDKRAARSAQSVGSVHRVLVERRQAVSGLLTGFSENYLPLAFAGPASLVGRVVTVRVTEVVNDQPLGELITVPLED